MADPTRMPPAGDGLTLSEVIPFSSRKVSFWRSRALVPLVVTGIVCILLYNLPFRTRQDVTTYMDVVAVFVLAMTFFAVYYYSGERKNVLWYIWPALFTYYQLENLLQYYDDVFYWWLPGKFDEAPPQFVPTFIAYFFGAGLREESLKAGPMLIALAAAFLVRRSRRPAPLLLRGFVLEGPVDGLLMGVAAGAGFTFGETLYQYVPDTIDKVAQSSNDIYRGYLSGLQLLLPRVLDGVMGHSAYAGIFGYFAGLSVTHPRATWKLLPLGWLVAAIVHTLWDSLDTLIGDDYYLWVAGPVTLIVFFGCLMKAKQLEVSRLGGAVDGHSILALSPPPDSLTRGPAGIVPPEPPGLAGLLTRGVSGVERAVGVRAATTAPGPGAPVVPAAVPPTGISIGTATARYALRRDYPIDFAVLFAGDGVPSGCRGLIRQAEGGSFEIENVGSAGWSVTSPDGATASVLPGQRVAGSPGTALRLGPATLTFTRF